MLEGSTTNLFTKIHSNEGNYLARNHLGQMIALLGPPPEIFIMRELEMWSWNFAPSLENDENKPCHKVYDFYHGPFFDEQGNTGTGSYLATWSLSELIRVYRKIFVSRFSSK
jgi:hypothetical protein